jgi:hypothetical protein
MATRYQEARFARKQAKLDKKKARQQEKQEVRDYRGWTKVTGRAICGCCCAVLWYTDRVRANNACKGATHKHALMKDDRGNEEMVDGFYGFDIVDF